MTEFFKAVRPDGRDFYTGGVDYASLSGTGQQLPELPGGPCCTASVYHASTVPWATLVGGSWPCRLFTVEGDPVSQEETKRGFRTLRVREEIAAWQALGPGGEAAADLVERAGRLTRNEAKRIGITHMQISAYSDQLFFHRKMMSDLRANDLDCAMYAAGNAAWDAVQRIPETVTVQLSRGILSGVRRAAKEAAWVLVARHLITPEQFDYKYSPWGSVIGPEGS